MATGQALTDLGLPQEICFCVTVTRRMKDGTSQLIVDIRTPTHGRAMKHKKEELLKISRGEVCRPSRGLSAAHLCLCCTTG